MSGWTNTSGSDDRKLAIERHRERRENQLAATIESGHNALKASLIINGGSCVALLGFLATTFSADKAPQQATVLLSPMIDSLTFFASGTLLAALAAGLGYLTNLFAASALGEQKYSMAWPYVLETSSSKRWNASYVAFSYITIALALLSYVAFACGVAKIRGLF